MPITIVLDPVQVFALVGLVLALMGMAYGIGSTKIKGDK